MKNVFVNWKTTSTGILMVLAGLAGLFGIKTGAVPMSPEAAVSSILGGLGLIFAKDGNVTGGTTQQ